MGGKELVLSSPDHLRWQFTVRIIENRTSNITLFVTGNDPENDAEKTFSANLNTTDHSSYLNFFEKLSLHFATRLPQNRKKALKSTVNINYTEVLTQNLDAGMLYGYGDPAIIRIKEKGRECYYLLTTSNDAPNAFPVLRSENLKDWSFVTYVFPEGMKPQWAETDELISDYWAPEMHQVGPEFRVYFVAREKKTGDLCIGLARSLSPDGPFNPHPEPLLKGNVIDPHLYIQDENTTFLFWKEDSNDLWPRAFIELLVRDPSLVTFFFDVDKDQRSVSFLITCWPWLKNLGAMDLFLAIQSFIEAAISRFSIIYKLLSELSESRSGDSEAVSFVLDKMKTRMYAQQLATDGTTLIGYKTKIIENDLVWEAHLVEGVWLTEQNGNFFLFYAGNDFSTDQYGIGVAIAENALGPYKKMPRPFLQSTQEWLAPGHPSVTIAPDGQPTMFLHAYKPGEAGYKHFRALLSLPLRFEKDRVFAKK
jgi:arabinan endo-1,5-alpha-L-arabinosidase